MKLNISLSCGIVTGANSELGIALGQRLIDAGLFPVFTARNEIREAELRSVFGARKGKFETGILDFSDPTSLDTFFRCLNVQPTFLVDLVHGNLECFVGSASDAAIYSYFSENVAFRAAFVRRVARAMLRQRQGRMVYVSSVAAIRPNAGQGFYAAAKLASEAIYRNLGIEMGKKGITTVTLRPGYILAGRARHWVTHREKSVTRAIPMGRFLTLDEVANTILYLLSDDAASLNATEIIMDGGFSASKPIE